MYVPNEAVQTRNWYLIKQKLNFGCCGVWIVSKPNLCLQSPTSTNMWNTYGFSKFEPNNNLAVVCMVETLEQQRQFHKRNIAFRSKLRSLWSRHASHQKKTHGCMLALIKPLPRSVKHAIFHRVSKYSQGSRMINLPETFWMYLTSDFSGFDTIPRTFAATTSHYIVPLKKSNHMCDWLFKKQCWRVLRVRFAQSSWKPPHAMLRT